VINNLNVLAVVPARGGSKGLKDKNLQTIGDLSLVELALKSGLGSAYIDKICVSTDSEEIAKVANLYVQGAAPFRRPHQLSGDLIGDYQVLRHALETMESLTGGTFDILVMLQPTSPLRTSSIIDQVIEKLINENCDSVWSVSEVDLKYHPLKQLKSADGSKFDHYLADGSSIIARQQLVKTFIRNGMCYAFARSTIIQQESIKGKNSRILITSGEAISIDDQNDLDRCRSILV
jgi:CMP-N,N'-diacetyllegionaminic acid synthase